MLMPKKVKYRKTHKISYRGKAKGNTFVAFGEYGIKALEGGWISNRQIEAARISLARYTKRQGKVWIRIFPHLALTKKPLETRMGKGKGSPATWVAVVKEGTVMFEIAGVSEEVAKEALRLASQKLSVKCKIVTRERGE